MGFAFLMHVCTMETIITVVLCHACMLKMCATTPGGRRGRILVLGLFTLETAFLREMCVVGVERGVLRLPCESTRIGLRYDVITVAV